MNALLRHRRHPLAMPLLLVVGLFAMGALYAVAMPGAPGASATQSDEALVAQGRELFLANCSTCHGARGDGGRVTDGEAAAPSLVGVGAASVDFMVGTGRMPLTQSGPQAPQVQVMFSEDEIDALAAYVASLGPGPAVPDEQYLDPAAGNVADGAELFRVNCAMCHNFAGKGGALTRGKYAPNLTGVEPRFVYEAMLTGPQSMPVFGDEVMVPEDKRDIIAYLDFVAEEPSPGGLSLGALGPVSEGLVGWIIGVGGLIGCAVWIGARSS